MDPDRPSVHYPTAGQDAVQLKPAAAGQANNETVGTCHRIYPDAAAAQLAGDIIARATQQ